MVSSSGALGRDHGVGRQCYQRMFVREEWFVTMCRRRTSNAAINSLLSMPCRSFTAKLYSPAIFGAEGMHRLYIADYKRNPEEREVDTIIFCRRYGAHSQSKVRALALPCRHRYVETRSAASRSLIRRVHPSNGIQLDSIRPYVPPMAQGFQ